MHPKNRAAERVLASAIHHESKSRCGIATLELVLCMPLILALIVAIVWLGFSVIGQSKVAVEARHEAWKKRFDSDVGKPLNFLVDDFITEDATTQIRVTPLLNDASSPESSHDITVGMWDHKQVDMNSPPNWEHYATAAVNAKTGGMQVAYTDARNQLGQLQEMAGRIILEEVTEAIKEAFEKPFSDFEKISGGQKEEADQKAAEEKNRLDGEIQRKRGEIDRAKTRLEQIEDGADEDDARVKIQKNKIKRLEAELALLKQDRDSLD